MTTLSILLAIVVNAVLAAGTVDVPLVARGSAWNYTTADPGASWFALSYVPATQTWVAAFAPFGSEPGSTSIIINTTVPLTTSAVWFVKTFTFSGNALLSGSYLAINVAEDPAADVYFNGVLLDSAGTLGVDFGNGALALNRQLSVPLSSVNVGANVVAVRLTNPQPSDGFGFDAEIGVQFARVGDTTLLARGSAWQYSLSSPAAANWTKTLAPPSWALGRAPFGADANPVLTFNTPLPLTAATVWFSTVASIGAADVGNAAYLLLGVACDSGADVYFNGVLVSAATSVDDGGYRLWNSVVTLPTSTVVLGQPNVIAVRLVNVQPSDGLYFDAELGVVNKRLGDRVLLPRHSAWRWTATTPSAPSWWLPDATSTLNWPTSAAPFGADSIVGRRFNTPIDLTQSTFYFTTTFRIDASALVNATTVLIGVAADLGADIWLNGQQLDNQATLGGDDGGATYWSRQLQAPASLLVVGDNFIAAMLNNANQPSDGTSFDAEVSVVVGTVGDFTIVPRGSLWQWTSTAPGGGAWRNGSTPGAAAWLAGTTLPGVAWTTSAAPFGADAESWVRYNTPLDLSRPSFWFVNTFAVSASVLAQAQSVVIGVAADIGADVWLNGQQLDNQATLGGDDGGGAYWNRWLQASTSLLSAGGNNVLAVRLNNAQQPSDGTSFDAEVGLQVAPGASTSPASAPLPATQVKTASMNSGGPPGGGYSEDDGDDDSPSLAAVVVLGVLLALALVVILILGWFLYKRHGTVQMA